MAVPGASPRSRSCRDLAALRQAARAPGPPARPRQPGISVPRPPASAMSWRSSGPSASQPAASLSVSHRRQPSRTTSSSHGTQRASRSSAMEVTQPAALNVNAATSIPTSSSNGMMIVPRPAISKLTRSTINGIPLVCQVWTPWIWLTALFAVTRTSNVSISRTRRGFVNAKIGEGDRDRQQRQHADGEAQRGGRAAADHRAGHRQRPDRQHPEADQATGAQRAGQHVRPGQRHQEKRHRDDGGRDQPPASWNALGQRHQWERLPPEIALEHREDHQQQQPEPEPDQRTQRRAETAQVQHALAQVRPDEVPHGPAEHLPPEPDGRDEAPLRPSRTPGNLTPSSSATNYGAPRLRRIPVSARRGGDWTPGAR